MTTAKLTLRLDNYNFSNINFLLLTHSSTNILDSILYVNGKNPVLRYKEEIVLWIIAISFIVRALFSILISIPCTIQRAKSRLGCFCNKILLAIFAFGGDKHVAAHRFLFVFYWYKIPLKIYYYQRLFAGSTAWNSAHNTKQNVKKKRRFKPFKN